MSLRCSPALLCSLSICLLALAASGCATLRTNSPDPLGDAAVDANLLYGEVESGESRLTKAPAGPTIPIAVKPDRGRVRQHQVGFEPEMTVHEALTAARINGKYRDMTVDVLRVTPYSRGVPVPLHCEYDPNKRRVTILHDIVLHEGDRIVVKEVSGNALTKMLGVFGSR